MIAELLSTTETFKLGSSALHITTASEPSEETRTIASLTLLLTAESAVTGPQEATPPEMVAELDFTAYFPIEEVSRHTAVAFVPSLDRAIFSPSEFTPTVDRSAEALTVGWAIATDAKPEARRETSSTKRCFMSELSENRGKGHFD
jgi:hypothetical protein